MDVNSVFAIMNIVIGVCAGVAGAAFLLDSRSRWREWPMAAMVLIGSCFASISILFFQLAYARILPIDPTWGMSQWFALLTRVVAIISLIYLTMRVRKRQLMSLRDRERAHIGVDLT